MRSLRGKTDGGLKKRFQEVEYAGDRQSVYENDYV
jgi:hypothetical protein